MTLTHIAIIPDGNRRWAKKRFLPAAVGHMKGAQNFEKIIDAALKMDVKNLTIWGGSFDNLTKRKKSEISALFKIYDKYFTAVSKSEKIIKNKVRVRVLGRFKELFSEKSLKIVEELENKTKEFGEKALTFLIGYNGTDEMLDAVKNIIKNKQEVTPELIKQNLWTRDLPPVDLVIRTGEEGDPHNSAGFMMWDTAYSQLYFTKTLWPVFSPKEFKKAVDSFFIRERRLGK